MRFLAILSDLDGVLVDSGASVEAVWRDWARERGIDPEAVARASHGVPARDVIAAVAPGLDAAEEGDRVDRLHAAAPAVALPGAAALLERAAPESLAVVTSGGRALAGARFEAAGLPVPACLITADMVGRGKPAPDAYLLAARTLGAEPAACVVIEDAPAGVRAGRAAGMTVWALSTTHAAAELAGAERVAPDVAALLEDLGLGQGP